MSLLPVSRTAMISVAKTSLRWTGAFVLSASVLVGCATETQNTSYEAQLAQHLSESGAAMYGAYWCPHCADQKELFEGAVDQVPYVECAADGENAQPQLCQEKGIQGYPTWEINGELYPGTRPLEELAELSGFQPPAGEP